MATGNGLNGHCVLRHAAVVFKYEQDNVMKELIPMNVLIRPVKLNLVTKDRVQSMETGQLGQTGVHAVHLVIQE